MIRVHVHICDGLWDVVWNVQVVRNTAVLHVKVITIFLVQGNVAEVLGVRAFVHVVLGSSIIFSVLFDL